MYSRQENSERTAPRTGERAAAGDVRAVVKLLSSAGCSLLPGGIRKPRLRCTSEISVLLEVYEGVAEECQRDVLLAQSRPRPQLATARCIASLGTRWAGSHSLFTRSAVGEAAWAKNFTFLARYRQHFAGCFADTKN